MRGCIIDERVYNEQDGCDRLQVCLSEVAEEKGFDWNHHEPWGFKELLSKIGEEGGEEWREGRERGGKGLIKRKRRRLQSSPTLGVQGALSDFCRY